MICATAIGIAGSLRLGLPTLVGFCLQLRRQIRDGRDPAGLSRLP